MKKTNLLLWPSILINGFKWWNEVLDFKVNLFNIFNPNKSQLLLLKSPLAPGESLLLFWPISANSWFEESSAAA